MSAPSLTTTKANGQPTPPPPREAGPVQAGGRFAKSLRRNLTAHGFLVGAVLCFGFFSWYPMVREFLLAFQRTENGRTTWVGLDNLRTVVDDPAFWQAWSNTALFTALSTRPRLRGALPRRDRDQRVHHGRDTCGSSSTCR
ncbi:hypothetical protein SGLAM104S_09045 [Streptomyces glaucescens]